MLKILEKKDRLNFFVVLIVIIFLTALEFGFLVSIFSYIKNQAISFSMLEIPSNDILLVVIALLLIKVITQNIYSIFLLKLIKSVLSNVIHKISLSVYRSGAEDSTAFISYIQHDSFYAGETLKYITLVTQEIFNLFVAIASIYYLYKNDVLYPTVLVCLLFLITFYVGKKFLLKLNTRRSLSIQELSRDIIDLKKLWPVITLISKVSPALRHLSRRYEELLSIDLQRGILAMVPKNLSDVVLLFGLIILASGESGAHSTDDVLIALIILMRITPLFGRLFSYVENLIYAYPSVKRLEARLAEDLDPDEDESVAPRTISWTKIGWANINKSYNGKKIFTGYSFHIYWGEKVALTGQNGSGKSTLLEILRSRISSDLCELQVDNETVKTSGLFLKMFTVTQNASLYSATIYENITLSFEPSKKDPENVEKIRSIFATLDLPLPRNHDLDSYLSAQISEEGSMLSGGERQVLAFVRALYHGSSLLLIDEGGSAMDIDTRKKFVKALLSLKDCAVVYVTHSAEESLLFDRIVSMNH